MGLQRPCPGTSSDDAEACVAYAAYQRAVHDEKLAMEISAAKRERDFYLSRIDKSKGIAAMQQRRAQQARESESAPKLTPAEVKPTELEEGTAQPKRVRAYGQRKPKADSVGANASTLPPSLLSLIAGRPQT
jgi:ESF2/ABP1 family protein